MTRTCVRCAVAYEPPLHTCAHPLHAAIDPACVYWLGGDVPEQHMRCDICGPIRYLMQEEGSS